MNTSNATAVLEAPATTRSRIYIVDDHPLVRESLAALLGRQADLDVCGQSGDATTAYADIVRLVPDVAVVDLALPGESGLELIKKLQAVTSAPRVLVLSMHDEEFFAERTIRAGARGYLMKQETTEKVIDAIRQIQRGELYLSEALAAQFAEKFVGSRNGAELSTTARLTDRELEVYRLIGQGYETRRIAVTLHLSMKTVQAHCANIKSKLRLENATALLREAVRWVEHEGFR